MESVLMKVMELQLLDTSATASMVLSLQLAVMAARSAKRMIAMVILVDKVEHALICLPQAPQPACTNVNAMQVST